MQLLSNLVFLLLSPVVLGHAAVQELEPIKDKVSKWGCVDLVVDSFIWGPDCSLSVSIKNIGTKTAPAAQSVALEGSDVLSGDTFEWHQVNLPPGASGWVNFGVIEAAGSTITVTVDSLNFQPWECLETNNELVINVPDQCIGEEKPQCWNVYVCGPQGIRRLDTETLQTTTLVSESILDVGFRGSSLWALNAGLIRRYSTSNGQLLQTVSANVNGLALGTDPNGYDLVGNYGSNLVSIDTSTGATTPVVSISYSISGDLTAFGGDFYVAVSTGSTDSLLRVTVGGTETLIGTLPSGNTYGLAEVGVVGGTELWAFALNGNIWSIDITTGAGVLVGDISGSIWGAASAPCPQS